MAALGQEMPTLVSFFLKKQVPQGPFIHTLLSSQLTALGVYDKPADFEHDMFIKIEKARLKFLRKEQSILRDELFKGAIDTIMAEGYRDDKANKRMLLSFSSIRAVEFQKGDLSKSN